jgi:putative PIN family toxin of toxin-antitoxin system
MKVVLDTNVVVSGIFYSGPPAAILREWKAGKISLVTSQAILDEYKRVLEVLSVQFPGVEVQSLLELIVVHSEVCSPPPLAEIVCEDPSDDKFLSVALAAGAKIIVSGDKHLLKVSGYRGISVLTPRQFMNNYFSSEKGT